MNKEPVFCNDCIHFMITIYSSQKEYCIAKENILRDAIYKNTYKARICAKSVQYKRLPKELNKENGCLWFCRKTIE